MSELRLRIAQDLTAIAEMFVKLRSEAVNRAGDPDIPGGAAMVMLGPGADVEAWNYVQMSALFGRLNLPDKEVAALLADDIEPPLSFLASWADIVREARNQEPTTRRATINGEVLYLRSALDWMLSLNDEGEPWFLPVESFADDLRKVRRAMEAVLHDGERDDKINARCKECAKKREEGDPPAPRLSVRKGEGYDGRDYWQCPKCKQGYDEDGVARCWRAMFVERGDPPEWLPLRQAAAAIARPVSTVRTWTLGTPYRKPDVRSEVRDDDRTWVIWADVRAMDERTRRRGRNRQTA
jgi:hypothetical protein